LGRFSNSSIHRTYGTFFQGDRLAGQTLCSRPGQSVAAFNQRLEIAGLLAVSSDPEPRHSTADGASFLSSMEIPTMARFEVSQFWLEAHKCFSRSQRANDRTEKLHWLTLAEGWLVLCERVEKTVLQQKTGFEPEFVSSPHQITRH